MAELNQIKALCSVRKIRYDSTFKLFLHKAQKNFFKKTPFTIYRQMQLDELIPNITLVLHDGAMVDDAPDMGEQSAKA
jgi:hypothetical protein